MSTEGLAQDSTRRGTAPSFAAHAGILRSTLLFACALVLLAGGGARAGQAQTPARTYDVVVYGGTASGVMAAIAAAGEGVRVALLEPGRHVGGMVTGGLSHTDFGDRAVIGGLALEFYRRVGAHYGVPTYYWRGPEPRIAEQILTDWLREAGVDVFFEHRLDTVHAEGRRIGRVGLSNGAVFEAHTFVDAGYEGDLMARAGVSYAVGREGRDVYGESWAGRLPILPDRHQFLVPVSPFQAGTNGKLLPLIKPEPMVEVGEGDAGIQSYCFRLLLTRRPDLRVPFPRPEGYDPDEFELMRRLLKQQGDELQATYFFTLRPNLPGEKAEINSVGPISLNLLDGSNWAYPDAGYERRQEIWDRHLQYTQRLMYFMANDPSVPEHIRTEVAAWGLARDEFVDTGHWPHQLYVRTGRRMLGEYVMTQADLERETAPYDAVGMGSYNIDVREVQRSWIWMSRFPELHPEVYNEGYLSVPVPPYQIPYRALLPKYHEAENLLVPVCLSSSHVANASIRMEPQYMLLGHAAGVAAAMAVREDLPVQHVPVAPLQARLAEQGQVLRLDDRPNGPFQTDDAFYIDDDMRRFVAREGVWQHYEDPVDRQGMSYLTSEDEAARIRYTPDLPAPGSYAVAVWWPGDTRNAVRVPVEVRHARGTDTLFVNQQEGGRWIDLGTWRFEAGREGFVGIGGGGPGRRVVADAVRFERRP